MKVKVEVKTIKVVSRALESRVLAGTFDVVYLNSVSDNIEKIEERIRIVKNLHVMTEEDSLCLLLVELSILLSSVWSEESLAPFPS